MIADQDSVVSRIYADLQALAEPRRVSAAATRQHFRRGYAMGPQGFTSHYLEVLIDQGGMDSHLTLDEVAAALGCQDFTGIVNGRVPTSLGESLLPILKHEGMTSEFVWYVLWMNLSSTWLGAMAWNMLITNGLGLPLLVEPLCSYLCDEDVISDEDRGAALSLENSLRNTPWGKIGIGTAPSYGFRLWRRTPPATVDPLLVLYGLYVASDVSNMVSFDSDQLERLPYGPCMALGITGSEAEKQLLSLWLPELLVQRREGERVTFLIRPERAGYEVVKEYSQRRGYL